MPEHVAKYRTPQTRLQKWAQAAFTRVEKRVATWEAAIEAGKRKDASKAEKERALAAPNQRDQYLSFARAFPTLIHVSGLAQATAFASVKSKGMRHEVLEDLDRVMREDRARGTAWTVCTESRTAGSTEYRLLTREAIAAALWLKRYAEALIEPEDAAGLRSASEDDGSEGQ